MKKNFLLNKRQVQQRFNRAAKTYAEHAIAYQEVAQRLLSKLEFIKINPERVLDLGCGSGSLLLELSVLYPQAQIIGVDLSYEMLQEAKQKNLVQADATFLPFPNDSVELVISNLMLPWCNDLVSVFQEVKRVLKPEGIFLFSTLGPDTLKELRAAWAKIDNEPHVHVFLDMHDIGDALLQSGLADPVMDVEHLTINYREFKTFIKDLKLTGSTNCLQQRSQNLLSKNKLKQLEKNYINIENKFPVTYEIAYGHAWKIFKPSHITNENEFYFSIEQLRNR